MSFLSVDLQNRHAGTIQSSAPQASFATAKRELRVEREVSRFASSFSVVKVAARVQSEKPLSRKPAEVAAAHFLINDRVHRLPPVGLLSETNFVNSKFDQADKQPFVNPKLTDHQIPLVSVQQHPI